MVGGPARRASQRAHLVGEHRGRLGVVALPRPAAGGADGLHKRVEGLHAGERRHRREAARRPSGGAVVGAVGGGGGGGADGGGGGGMRRVSSATCRGLRVEYSLLSRPRPSLSVPSSTPLYRATPRAPERASCTRAARSVPPYWRSVRNGSRRISQYGSGRK